MLKSLLILVFLAVGLLLPGLDAYTFTLRPFLMILLFFSFLNVRIDGDIFSRQQVFAAVLLLPVGLTTYYLGSFYSTDLGLTLLLMGLAPTAVITPVLAQILNRRANYMVGAIIITHAVSALAVPIILPALLGVSLSLHALGVLVWTIVSTVAGPLVLGQLVRRYGSRLRDGLRRIGPYTLILFLSNVAVAGGSLSHYLRYESDIPLSFIWVCALGVLALVLLNFGLGSRLAPEGHRVEGSLALGHKNTMLSIWIALEYVNPLTVLGPMLYILVQNSFVAVLNVMVGRYDRHRA